MDKFGIFNILSSLFGGTQTENSKNSAELPPQNPPYSSGENTQAEKRASFAPLKNSMLSTMKNHDEFVKRVSLKNKKQ